MAAPSKRDEAQTINHLHDEIIFAILDFVVISFGATANNFCRVLSLTHVSRRWMAILRDNGRIWSNIHIYDQDLAMLDAQITLCQKAPLFVSIKAPPHHLDLQTNIQGASSLIRQRRDQVKRLEVCMDCRTFQQHLGYEWPNLKEFACIDTCPDAHGASYMNLVPGVLPRLKILSLEGGVSWPMNFVAHLSRFKLRGPMNLELPTFAEFFRRNTSLESLELNNLVVRRPPNRYREKPIKLPHLTKLTVHNATCGPILPLLNLPSLKSLWVFSLKGRNPWSDYNWSELCSQLSVTTLEAYHSSSPCEKTTVVGSNGFDTQLLRFTDVFPTTPDAPSLVALFNASLPSVTSLYLIKNMPEGGVSSSLIAGMRDLLGRLPRVERMRLCPSGLAVGVVRRLSDNPDLCPELRELEVTVTDETCRTVMELLVEVLKVRAGGGDGKKIRKIKYLLPTDSRGSEEVRTRRLWNRLWKKAELGKYMSDE